MTGQPGFRIEDHWTRPAEELIAAFRDLPSPNVGDAMCRMGVVDPRIRAAWPGARCVGSALTVWTRAGDNLMIHKAIDMALPGDVVVVNGQADTTRALFGELMGHTASVLGLAGLVFDGVIRDTAALQAMGLPVFARGTSAAGPYKEGPGEIGRAVACGGVVCAPGDIVVADGDGVVIVSQRDAELVLLGARAVQAREVGRVKEIRAGHPRRLGIDEELIRRGVLAQS